MSDNAIPKEIFFSKYMTAFIGKERAVKAEIRCAGNEGDIKYLSEEHVNEMLAEKDKEIENLEKQNGILSEYISNLKKHNQRII